MVYSLCNIVCCVVKIQNRASGTDVKLRVSLENLLEAQRVGRWWIVGSSWSGAPMINEEKPTEQPVKGEQVKGKNKPSITVTFLAQNKPQQRRGKDMGCVLCNDYFGGDVVA